MYLAKDGTEIQDESYFETIEPQTLFVIAEADAQVKTGMWAMCIHGQVILSKLTLTEGCLLISFFFCVKFRFPADVWGNSECSWQYF